MMQFVVIVNLLFEDRGKSSSFPTAKLHKYMCVSKKLSSFYIKIVRIQDKLFRQNSVHLRQKHNFY